jgi:hypothetical protein
MEDVGVQAWRGETVLGQGTGGMNERQRTGMRTLSIRRRMKCTGEWLSREINNKSYGINTLSVTVKCTILKYTQISAA